MPRSATCDRWLFIVTVLLVLGGLLMVGSASNYTALQYGRNPSSFLLKHALNVILGFMGLAVAMALPYQRLASRAVVGTLLFLSAASLIIVLLMPPIGGAHRWIMLGPLRLQPSEFTKLAVIVFLAWILSRKDDQINDKWAVLVPCLGVVGGLAMLVVIEPDLGSAFMLVAVAGVMIFVAGLRWRYVLTLGGVSALGIAVAILSEPFRRERVMAYLNPGADPLGSNFQLEQSLIAIGKGGLVGAGLGHGQQKAFYIPAAHTDFIFSVIGEELGLLGTGVLLLAFLVLAWRGLRTAWRVPDRFGFYLALGLTNLIVLQALINMGVCLGLLPTKGLPMPFISYGGSSLLASMLAMGLLLNVSRHAD